MYDLPTSLPFSGPFLVIRPPRFPHLSFLPSNILVVASGVVVFEVGSIELCAGLQTRLKPVLFSNRISVATMVHSKRQNLWEPRVESNVRFQKVSWT